MSKMATYKSTDVQVGAFGVIQDVVDPQLNAELAGRLVIGTPAGWCFLDSGKFVAPLVRVRIVEAHQKAKTLHDLSFTLAGGQKIKKSVKSVMAVVCTVCLRLTDVRTAHLHQGRWIGDCCWDERLKSSE